MNQPLIWLAMLAVLALVAYMVVWRPHSRRLQLKIEPVPPKRLDNTPIERNEIVSPVRVRNRGTADAADVVEAEAEPTETADVPSPEFSAEPEAELPVEPAAPAEASVLPAEAPAPAPAAVVITQADLFPDALVPVRPRESSGRKPLFTAADTVEPVDATPTSMHAGEALPAIERVHSLHVMARDTAFDGRQLLGLLLQYGLRYGDMNIFHRHESPTGHGGVLFSLAQAMEPGTFDLDRMESSTVPGVSLFLSLPGNKSLMAYDLMVDTARRLAQEMSGDVLDASSQLVTPGQLDAWREEVIEFERKRLMSS